jgi:hypothetical protein
MDQSTIDQWRTRLAGLRRRLGNIKPDVIISFAQALGRKKRPGSSPPIYESPLPGRRSLPIHYHPRAMKRGTAKASLDVLEGDIDAWEMMMAERKIKENGDA